MYKFTNGLVVFDEDTKNEYIKAGYKLVEEKPKEEKHEQGDIEPIAKEYSRIDKKDSKDKW